MRRVVERAAYMKREGGGEDEVEIVVKAMIEVEIPRLLKNDTKVFLQILRT